MPVRGQDAPQLEQEERKALGLSPTAAIAATSGDELKVIIADLAAVRRKSDSGRSKSKAYRRIFVVWWICQNGISDQEWSFMAGSIWSQSRHSRDSLRNAASGSGGWFYDSRLTDQHSLTPTFNTD
jgi:hypothetical protein